MTTNTTTMTTADDKATRKAAVQRAGNFTAGMALLMPTGWHKMDLSQKCAAAKLVQAGSTPDDAVAEVLAAQTTSDGKARDMTEYRFEVGVANILAIPPHARKDPWDDESWNRPMRCETP